MRQPLLLLQLLSLFPTLELIAARPSHDNASDPVIHRVYNKFAAVKNISKRHVCPEGKHQSGDNCCDTCEPGYFKDQDCTTSSKTICKKCEEGKVYTDDYNYLPKCLRCNSCDTEHGLEVDKPCIGTQNVTCRCMHGFFCSSLERCHHCDPCAKCENGIIIEECTPTKDTICVYKPNLVWITAIVILPVLFGILFIIWKYCGKKCRIQIKDEQETMEMKSLIYPDIDLTHRISDIAEEMTLEQVLKFVRKQGLSNPTIEKINLDNINDASEKKIKLLDTWFQENGIKDAYGTLIRCLKDLKLRTLAQKIEHKMAPHIQNDAAVQVYQNITSLEENNHI